AAARARSARETRARAPRLDRAPQEGLHRAARGERQVGDPAADRPGAAFVRVDARAGAPRPPDSPRERGIPANLRPRLGARRTRRIRRPGPGTQAGRPEVPAGLRALVEQGPAGEGEAD